MSHARVRVSVCIRCYLYLEFKNGSINSDSTVLLKDFGDGVEYLFTDSHVFVVIIFGTLNVIDHIISDLHSKQSNTSLTLAVFKVKLDLAGLLAFLAGSAPSRRANSFLRASKFWTSWSISALSALADFNWRTLRPCASMLCASCSLRPASCCWVAIMLLLLS